MMKLKINKSAKEGFEKMLKSFPFTERYKSLIEKELNCSWEEVVCLGVHPDNEKSDEEGWNIDSFFPREIQPHTELISKDYHTEDFTFGQVIRLKQGDASFVADENASPWTVYANPKQIQIL